MLFNEKHPKFKSEIHKIIWAYGRAVVPFDVSTADITDKDMLEGLRQVYDFNAAVFDALLENPEKYNATTNTAEMGRGVLRLPRSLSEFVRFDAVNLVDDEWVINTDGLASAKFKKISKMLNTLDLLKPMGLSYKIDNKIIKVKNTKYPLFVKYYSLLVQAASKKTDIWRHVVFCDFRILNKRYVVKFDDMLKFFSEENSAFALELNDFLSSKGCKASISCHNVNYMYKKLMIASISVSVSLHCRHHTDLRNMSVSIGGFGRSETGDVYVRLLDKIESEPNKDELRSYLSTNRKRCNTMGCMGSESENCFSIAFIASINAESKDFADNHDMKMLKQILDLRLKAIEILN